MSDLRPGSTFDDRFQVLELLGQGGMGIVYRARQSNMQRDVALKVLRGTLLGQPDKMKRFRREAQLISRLEHPNIVRVFAVGVADGQPYIAMEYLSGRQLSEIIERDGPMPWRSAVKLFLQLCDALEYAHGREIIHRDIKPSNIVIVADPSSGESCLKLVDFGIAKSTGGQQLTRTEMVVGSAFYLSPGQFQGRSADVRSDVYSFGCALFEVLTGTVPFRGDTIYDTIQNKTNNNLGRVNEINSQAEIPSDLQRLLEWMTHSESEFRPPSIDAVRQALHSILDGKPVAFTSAPVPSRTPDRVSGSARLRLSAIVACAVILLIGLIYLFSTQWLERPAAKPVQLGAFLTDSAKERQLASQVNNRSSEESVLVQAYIQLSVLYCENHFKLPGLLCVERALALAERSNMQNSQMYADALYRKATLLRDFGFPREAIAALYQSEKHAARRGFYPIHHKQMEMQCFIAAGDWDAGAKLFDEAKRHLLGSEDSALWALAAECYVHVGRYQDAQKAADVYVKSIASSPSRVDVLTLICRQVMHKDVTDAEVQQQEGLTRMLKDDDLFRALAYESELAIHRGYPKEAANRLRTLVNELIKRNQTDSDWYPVLMHARQNIAATCALLPEPERSAAGSDLRRLDAFMATERAKLNDRSAVRLPVPI